ncbi:hypothetical protein D3C71_1023170 [compost metagenome]
MIAQVSPNATVGERLLTFQREEVANLERAVSTYSAMAAEYERRLAEARRRLAVTERRVAE